MLDTERRGPERAPEAQAASEVARVSLSPPPSGHPRGQASPQRGTREVKAPDACVPRP
jgi:hypothetical protein